MPFGHYEHETIGFEWLGLQSAGVGRVCGYAKVNLAARHGDDHIDALAFLKVYVDAGMVSQVCAEHCGKVSHCGATREQAYLTSKSLGVELQISPHLLHLS
jgi:hypothetical protein